MHSKTIAVVAILCIQLSTICKYCHNDNPIKSVLKWIYWIDPIPNQRCSTSKDCDRFCTSYGYNHSECNTKVLRISRYCECYDCDFVLCATYCTKQNLKFMGCSCFTLPTLVGQTSNEINNLLTNECHEGKFFCQCSKWMSDYEWNYMKPIHTK